MDATLTAAAIGVGGSVIVAVAAFWASVRNTSKTTALTLRAVGLTEQGQVTDRYSKAIEQLGSDKLDVRLGGIYALERIARDSPRDLPTIMEVLAAFVREHSHEQWPPAKSDGAPPPKRAIRPDVQAALTVIGRRDATHDTRPIDLSYAELPEAKLPHDAGLAEAKLSHAVLTGMDLIGQNLSGADLTDANLTGAQLGGVDLTDAVWPTDMAAPEGWQRRTDWGSRLERSDTNPGEATAN